MKIGVNEIQIGHVLEMENKKYVVRKKEHVKPGKGGAFVQLELKELITNKKYHKKISTDKSVDKIDIYELEAMFLYEEKNQFVFSKGCSGDIIESDIPDNKEFFVPGEKAILVVDSNDNLLQTKLPKEILCQVDFTDGYISGQSAASQMKNATLTNGKTIKVPQHIKSKEHIVIETEGFSFVRKANIS